MYCGRFYKQINYEKICKECAFEYKMALEKLKNNKSVQKVLNNLSNL